MIISLRKFKYKIFSPISKKFKKKYKRYKNKKKLKLLPFFFIFMFSFLFLMFSINFTPAINNLANFKLKNLAVNIANEVVICQIENEKDTNLENIERDKYGTISSIETNVIKLNILKSKIIQDIEKRFENLNYGEIRIPIGSIFKNEMFYGRGPKIPIKIIILNSLDTDLKSTFTSCGINQTKHEVILNVKINATALLPFGKTETEATTQIPITETIIVGSVPNTCLNMGT
ncbi:MAG: sporulation protein YunB [Clostridiales bacterium]|jgi:sporulation protein YunB|nr:sporulation protein YunB [Clostridiales bacterium]